MAAKTASLSVNIIGDASKAKAAFRQAEEAAGSFSNQLKSASKALATGFVGAELVKFAKQSIKATSDLGESMNAVRVTFGNASAGILKFGETAAKTVGMSQAQFNSFAVQFAGFTQQISGSTGDVSKVTAELTKRIADFASVMNLDIAEAAQVFQSSLAGQTEPIRRFGIDMSAAAVEAYALKNGLAASKDEMTEGIKVQARYGLLMEATAKTAGDFANTSDSLANRQRILSAEFENMKAKVGEALLPAMENLLNIVGPLIEGFNSLNPTLRSTLSTITLSTAITASFGNSLKNLGFAAGTVNTAMSLLNVALIAYNLHQQRNASENQRTTKYLAEWAASSDESLKKTTALSYASMVFSENINSGSDALKKFAETSVVQAQKLVDMGLAQSMFNLTSIEAERIIQNQINAQKRLNENNQINAQIIDGSIKPTQSYVDAWKEGYRAQIDARNAANGLSDSLEQVNKRVNVGVQLVNGLTLEWELFLKILDKRDAFDNAKDAVTEYEETFKKALKGNKEAQDSLNDSLRTGQRELANAVEAADLIPAEQMKKILFLTETGQLAEALRLLQLVDSWYMTVQERAAITPSGMGYRAPEFLPPPALGPPTVSAPLPPRAPGAPAAKAPAAKAPVKSPTAGKVTPYKPPKGTVPTKRYSGLAAGGSLVSSGMVMVGEEGPELLSLPRGASVIPSIPSRRMAGAGQMIVNITVQAGLVSSPDQVGMQIIDAIRRAERRSGQVFAAA